MLARVGLVGQSSSAISGQTITVTSAAAIPAGRLLLVNYVCLIATPPNGGQPLMSDNAGVGNSWNNGANAPAWSGSGAMNMGQDFLFTRANIPSGTVFTCDFGAVMASRYLDIRQYAGASSIPTFISGNAGNVFSGTALTSNTIPSPTGGKKAFLTWGIESYLPSSATLTDTSSPAVVQNFNAVVGTMRVISSDSIIDNATGGWTLSGTTSAAMTEGLALYDSIPIGPEEFHDQPTVMSRVTHRRASGLVIPRAAIYRSRR